MILNTVFEPIRVSESPPSPSFLPSLFLWKFKRRCFENDHLDLLDAFAQRKKNHPH